MEKWLILGLEQEIYKMSLNHLVVTEKEELAHGGDIGKYYNSGMAQPYFIKKIKSLWGDL